MRRIALVAVAAAGVLGFVLGGQGGATANLPADKVSASGSVTEVAGPGEEITVLEQRIRTSAPADLVLDLTSECAIISTLETQGDDSASSTGVVRAWIEIDGRPVPVASAPDGTAGDDGRITLCSRSYSRTTSGWGNNLNGEDDTIKDALSTRDANGFSWMAFNVGKGIHDVVVKATLTETSVNKATTEVAIGKRTLTISPTHAAVGEGTIADL